MKSRPIAPTPPTATRRDVIGLLRALPCRIAVGAMCLVGVVETTPEMSPQNVWFVYSAAALMVCAVLCWAFNTRKTKLGIVDLAATDMLVWYLVCYATNGSVAISNLLEICFYIPIYVSLRIIFSSYRFTAAWMFVLLCGLGIFESFVGFRQAFGAIPSNHGLFNVTGTFFNPGPYGGYLAVILALAVGYAVSRYRYFRIPTRFRIIWTSVFLVAVCAALAVMIILPSTMSRAAFVAVAVVAVAVVLSNEEVYRPAIEWAGVNKKTAFIIGLVSVVVISASAWGAYVLKKDSAEGRLFMWKMLTGVMLENPVTGVGPGYFRGVMADVQAEYFAEGRGSETEVDVAGCPEYGFNEYLQIGAETGVVGLLLFLFLIAIALRQLFRNRSFYAFGLLALAVFACFSYPFGILPMKLMFVSFLAAAGSSSRDTRNVRIVERIVIAAVLAAGVFISIFLSKPYLARVRATDEWREVRRLYSMELYPEILEDYRELFPSMKDNPEFLFEYGRSLNREGRYAESLDILIPATRLSGDPMFYNVIGNNHKAVGDYNKAAEAYLKAWHILPARMYPPYLLAKMYVELGDEENAGCYARRVVEMIPKIPSPATDDMQREMEELLKNIKNSEVLQDREKFCNLR